MQIVMAHFYLDVYIEGLCGARGDARRHLVVASAQEAGLRAQVVVSKSHWAEGCSSRHSTSIGIDSDCF